MRGKSPAGPLIREHRVIERMLASLQREFDVLVESGEADPVTIELATDFIRWYADRCHHGKEEDILFARLAEKTIDDDLRAQMEELIEEHVYARDLTRRLVAANVAYMAGEQDAIREIESMMRALIQFYPRHIEKEDRHFFKPSLEQFTEEELADMLRDFDEFDATLIHRRYGAVVDELADRTSRNRTRASDISKLHT
jgi:hemerythrin-like domain-containing protein